MTEIPKSNETQNSQPKSLENNIKIYLKSWKIDITADNKLTKNELKSIENMLTKDKNEIINLSKQELWNLKQVVEKDLQNRLDRGKNSYISSLKSRIWNLESVQKETTTEAINQTVQDKNTWDSGKNVTPIDNIQTEKKQDNADWWNETPEEEIVVVVDEEK